MHMNMLTLIPKLITITMPNLSLIIITTPNQNLNTATIITKRLRLTLPGQANHRLTSGARWF
jgi:hypothetical protein